MRVNTLSNLKAAGTELSAIWHPVTGSVFDYAM